MQFDPARFKAIIHYICRKKAMEPDQLGAVKLHKILWYTDIKSFRISGEALTGASYKKMPRGPFANELENAIKELEEEHKLSVSKVDFFDYDKCQFIGKGDPDRFLLGERTTRWLDEVISTVCGDHTAASISDKSHDEMWESAEMYEPLPVSAAAIRFVKPSEETIQWARDELGLN